MPKLTNRGPAGLLKKKDAAVESGEKPKLTNRGGAGLLSKVKAGEKPIKKAQGTKDTPNTKDAQATNGAPLPPPRLTVKEKNRIDPPLMKMVVDIDTLIPDPNNARLHPDRNLESIMDSLALYGQLHPLVVRKTSRVVIAGNGRLEAAKKLGWTKIAANFTDLSEADAVGYGLADNRTAELAKWDFEIIARLDKLVEEQTGFSHMIGWSTDEIEVLRQADWTPPEATGGDEGTVPKVSNEEFNL